MKPKPTDPLRTTVAMLSEEDSPHMVSLATLVTVISRTWSPGKNITVVSEVKYDSTSCAYSESVAQWVEQDEHEVAMGVTQYTFSGEQWERMLMSSAAPRTVNGVD